MTQASAQKVQGAFRARKGRDRTHVRRIFVDAKKAALRAAQQIYPSFISEVLEIEAPPPLALFRVLSCVMTLAGSTLDESGVTWQTIKGLNARPCPNGTFSCTPRIFFISLHVHICQSLGAYNPNHLFPDVLIS